MVTRQGCRRLDHGLRKLEVGAAHAALALDEGDEEARHVLLQLGDPLQDPAAGTLLPAFDHDLAVPGVEGGDDPLAGELGEDLGLGHGAEDDLGGTEVEPADRGLDIADAAADPGMGSGRPSARPGRRCCRCAWPRRGR